MQPVRYPTYLSMDSVVSGYPDWMRPFVVQSRVDKFQSELRVKCNGPFGLVTNGIFEQVAKYSQTRVYRLKCLRAAGKDWNALPVQRFCFGSLVPAQDKHELDGGRRLAISCCYTRQVVAMYNKSDKVHVGNESLHLYELDFCMLYPLELLSP